MPKTKPVTKKQARDFIRAYMKMIDLALFCHAKGCRRKKAYLERNGYVGSPVNGPVYCMEHQRFLKLGIPKKIIFP